jgi:hypothetical protein
MAEGLAFNQTIGFVGSYPIRGDMARYMQFYRQNRALYTGTKDAGNVAMLRSFPSITYNHARAQLSAVLMEQALIQARIPFDLVFDEHLQDLSKYKVLILPDSECLSDAQLAAIRGFVEQGGGLIATGQAGLYDQWRRLRVDPGLQGMVENQRRARGYEERVERVQTGGAPVRKEYKGGRVVYIPSLEFDGPLPAMGSYFEIGPRYWKLPKNWEQVSDAVRWAARDELPVRVSGPAFLVSNVVEQPHRLLIHLVNYNRRSVPSVRDIQVSCRQPVKEIQVYSPDAETVSIKPAATFTVPEVKTYSIVAARW